MMVRITDLWSLRVVIKQVEECFADFCRRAGDELTPEQLWELVAERLTDPRFKDTFGFWLCLDGTDVQGFAMTRFIRDAGTSWSGDIWRVYAKPGARSDVLEEGLPTLLAWFQSFGVSEVTFATQRNGAAWSRRLSPFGFEPSMTIFRKKVDGVGEPQG